MDSTPSILQKKSAFENFTRQSIKSTYLRELSSQNKSYRHFFRFAFHCLFFASTLACMLILSGESLLAAAIVYPVYLFFQGLVIAGFMIHSHELSHGHIKSKFWNELLGVISGYMSFINYYSFQRAHRLHHRNIGNLDEPEAGAPISPKGQKKILHDDVSRELSAKIFEKSYLLGIFASWPIFIFYGDYNSWILPFKVKGVLNVKSLLCFLIFALLNLLVLAFFPLAYLLLFFIPVLLGGNRILAITYMHHAHKDSVFFNEDHHNFFNVIMSTTDRDFGRIVNFFMLNNGYHIPHHLNPQIAYYDLEKASRYLRETLPPDLSYNFYPNSRFYRDFAQGLYEQRLQEEHEFYQLDYFQADVPGANLWRKLKL